MMKRICLFILVALLAFSVPAFATSARYGLTFTPIAVDTASALGAGTWVYGVGFYAADGAGSAGLYDVATLGEATTANLSAPESGHATQYASDFNWYEKPIYFATAVTAVVSNGVGMIASGPEPTE